jgi:hypothetical protein
MNQSALVCPLNIFCKGKVKVKQSLYRPAQALRVPVVEAPRFQDKRHVIEVRLSALRIGRLNA